MPIAQTIFRTDEERITLLQWSRGGKTPVRLVLRARTVLAAADGTKSREIAVELKCAADGRHVEESIC